MKMVAAVKKELEKDAAHISATEMMAFWKTCTPEDKAGFRAELIELGYDIDPEQAPA